MDSTIYDSAKIIRDGLPDAKERRRYALLQAAATLSFIAFGKDPVGAVDRAESLLEIIEHRESESQGG